MAASVSIKEHGREEEKGLQKVEFSFVTNVTSSGGEAGKKQGSQLKMPGGRVGLCLGNA